MKEQAIRRLRCFVGMAFGEQDTDAIYSFYKRSLSGEYDFRRVDQINHNDDIDNKIIEEIKQADLMVADLTYARPSVYWEAGFAQSRPIPVVYIARQDHVGKKATDDSKRVHFDLQMRNIITWTIPNQQFIRQLTRRMKHVSMPIRSRLEVDNNAKQREQWYGSLSLIQKRSEAFKLVAECLQGTRWSIIREKDQGFEYSFRYAAKFQKDHLYLIDPHIRFAISQNDLRAICMDSRLHNFNLNQFDRMPKNITIIHILIPMRKLRTTTIETVFPEYSANAESQFPINGHRILLPNKRLWKSGKMISEAYGHSGYYDNKTLFKVGDSCVKVSSQGTVLHEYSKEDVRIGNSEASFLTRQILLINAPSDPADISSQLQAKLSNIVN